MTAFVEAGHAAYGGDGAIAGPKTQTYYHIAEQRISAQHAPIVWEAPPDWLATHGFSLLEHSMLLPIPLNIIHADIDTKTTTDDEDECPNPNVICKVTYDANGKPTRLDVTIANGAPFDVKAFCADVTFNNTDNAACNGGTPSDWARSTESRTITYELSVFPESTRNGKDLSGDTRAGISWGWTEWPENNNLPTLEEVEEGFDSATSNITIIVPTLGPDLTQNAIAAVGGAQVATATPTPNAQEKTSNTGVNAASANKDKSATPISPTNPNDIQSEVADILNTLGKITEVVCGGTFIVFLGGVAYQVNLDRNNRMKAILAEKEKTRLKLVQYQAVVDSRDDRMLAAYFGKQDRLRVLQRRNNLPADQNEIQLLQKEIAALGIQLHIGQVK